MPAAIVSSKGGGRITRAAAPAPAAATSSFSGGSDVACRNVISFGSGGGGGGGSSDIGRYRLHVEPANAAAAATTSVAGLQISSSNRSKADDLSLAAAGGPRMNRLKPALPHAWMDTGHDLGASSLWLRSVPATLIEITDSAADGWRAVGAGGKDDVAQLKERLAR